MLTSKQLFQYYQEHKTKVIFIVVVVVVFGLGFTYGSIELTSTPEFCSQCHEMEHSYTTWKKSSHYNVKKGERRATCKDCHLPTWRQPGELVVAKVYHGTKDVYHHFADQEEMKYKYYQYEMKMKARKSIPKNSCIECHRDTLYSDKPELKIYHADLIKNKRLHCVDCHKNLVHN